MSDFFTKNLDFVFLLYGLSAFVLAMTAGSLARRRERGPDWRFLCAFGFIHGASEWLDMLRPAMGAERWFGLLAGVVLSVSFLCLFEFSRRSLIWSRKRKVGIWIYYPGLLVVLLGVYTEPTDFLPLVQFSIGFPAGVLAALALWQSRRGQSEALPWWSEILGPLAMGLYGVSVGLIDSSAHFWPANQFSAQWFMSLTGVPVQVLRCFLIGTLTLALWYDYDYKRLYNKGSDLTRRIGYVRWVAFIAISCVVMAGWLLVDRADRQCRDDHTRRLASMSRGLAAVISYKDVRDLTEANETIGPNISLNLRLQCQRICEADPGIRYVYLMTMRDNKVVFLVDVEPERFRAEKDRPNAVFGEVYENPPAELLGVFTTREPVVSQPYSDVWGQFVSGFAPILDSEGNVIAVLGIDEQGVQWVTDIIFARLLRLLLTGGGVLLLLLFVVIWRREIEDSQIKHLDGQRMHRQQSALLRIANSTCVADGETFIMARTVTAVTAEIIDVNRVELWLKVKDDGTFRAEDIFQSGAGTHTAGQYSRVSEGDPFLKLLEEGRVTPCSNFQDDTRFGVMKDEWGRDVRSLLVAPLRVAGRLTGWLTAIHTSRCRNWLTDEMRFIAEMADQATHTLINHERRLAEEALHKAHDELERRVRERTEALSLKNAELLQEMNERHRIEDEQRILQDRMQQAQKLESLGLMAGGIAHDFNNILMAIIGNVELARLEMPESSPIYEFLQDIDKASCRAADLARQMLIYSGRGHASIQGIDVNDMVNDMMSILKVSLGKKIHLSFDLEPVLPLVDGDLTQLRQVLMNLVMNASEAIGNETGSIALRTGVIQYDQAMLASMWLKEALPAGKYVFIDVIDSGCGMDELTVRRIFDPFFTTKFTGRGLGLAAVLGIIKGHHGAIDVVSEVGKGTQFRVILPMGVQKSCPEDQSPQMDQPPWKGSGTILLADDEETVRTLGRRMLERIGFTVLEASDGNEAIEVFMKHHAALCCVLMDLTMPNLDGKEALEGIRKIDPEAKVVLCSGYMVENMVENFSDWEVSGYLQKPYKLESLITLMRQVTES